MAKSRKRKKYDPVLPSDFPAGTPAEVMQKYIGSTDPAKKRKPLVPQLPERYKRNTAATLTPPERIPINPTARANNAKPTAERRLEQLNRLPEPKPVERKHLAPLQGPSITGQRSKGPEGPAKPDRPSIERLSGPNANRAGSSFLSRKPILPKVKTASGPKRHNPMLSAVESYDRHRSLSVVAALTPPELPDMPNVDIPEMNGQERKGIQGITTYKGFTFR